MDTRAMVRRHASLLDRKPRPSTAAIAPVDNEHKISQEETSRPSRRKFLRRDSLQINEPEPTGLVRINCRCRDRLKKDLDSFQGLRSHIAERCSGIHLHADAESSAIDSVRRIAFDRATANTTSMLHDDLRRLQGIARQTRQSIDPQARMPDSPASSLEQIHNRAIEHAEHGMPWQGTDPGNTRGAAWATSGVHDLDRAVNGWHFYETRNAIFEIATLG